MTVSPEFIKQLAGYSLTTAKILYHMPDHHGILQEYLWQDYDDFPKLPVLRGFLKFWETNLEGPLHSVRVAHRKLIRPAELRLIGTELRLH